MPGSELSTQGLVLHLACAARRPAQRSGGAASNTPSTACPLCSPRYPAIVHAEKSVQKQAHGASYRTLRRAETRACALLSVPIFSRALACASGSRGLVQSLSRQVQQSTFQTRRVSRWPFPPRPPTLQGASLLFFVRQSPTSSWCLRWSALQCGRHSAANSGFRSCCHPGDSQS